VNRVDTITFGVSFEDFAAPAIRREIEGIAGQPPT
jgi:hypothetical protein